MQRACQPDSNLPTATARKHSLAMIRRFFGTGLTGAGTFSTCWSACWAAGRMSGFRRAGDVLPLAVGCCTAFGAKETRRDEVTDVRNVGTQITSGGNLTLESGGEIAFEAVKDLHQESHEKSKSSFVWNSMGGKGNTDETVLQSQLIAQGEIAIKAVEGLKIDIKQIDQKTVSETVDAMVAADPQLAWLKQVEQRGDVDWRRVKEIHDSYKYSHSGLGGGAAIIIAIIVAYFTAGAASGLVVSSASTAGLSTAGGGVWAAGTGASLSGIGWANAAVTAGLTGMASNAAVSTINNRGNLGAVLKDVTSNEAMRGYVVAGVTAGLTTGVFDGWTNTETGTSTALPNSGAVTTVGGLNTWGGVGRFTGNQLLQNGTSTLVDRALGGDSKFSDALRTSLPKIGLHALMGGSQPRLQVETSRPVPWRPA